MPLFPEINFHQIRGKAPSGSRRDGFEEFGSQLMIYGDLVEWPQGTTFTTFGNPDGGREGRGELPSGDAWCWQTKYLFELGDAEFKQIDKSVRRAISTEPTLARYYVILPYNRPGGDTEKAKSAWTKWKNHVEMWKAAAVEAGRTVRFEYIGETQLIECLLQPSQVGRLRYWFDLDGFSEERFRDIAARAEATAGGRYSPELNVGLPIAEVFDGLARTPVFEHEIRTRLAALRKARGTYGLSIPAEEPELFKQAIARVDRCFDQLDEAVTKAASQSRRPHGILPDLHPLILDVDGPLDHISDLLRQYCLRDGHYYDNAGSLYSQISKLESAIYELRELTIGPAWRSFGCSAILVTGTGGSGKTHLLCDLAIKRTSAGLPTLIALGEQFERGPIDAELGRIIGFNGPPSQLLDTFDVACQTVGEIGLVIIDALNEATDRSLWRKYLGTFLTEVARRPHLRLVLSCRTEFLDDTLPSDLQERLLAFQHKGFEDVTPNAIRQFLDWYGIERPSFPLIDPEFTNPFFLKLLCTTLQQRGEHRFPRTGIGTTWIYDSFIEAMDARLAVEERCDYDRTSGLVRRAVEQIAAAMHAHGRRLPRGEIERITSDLLPNRQWSRSLLNGLLKEAVLSELMVERGSYIRFGYERLGDIALAKLIASKDLTEVQLDVVRLAERWHANSGVLQALASVLPETHSIELIDLIEIRPTEFHYAAHTDFLFSLAWRQATAFSERTIEILLELRNNPDATDRVYNSLLQVAAVPDHKLNARWLHQHLSGISLPERDATWSYFCDQQEEVNGHLPVLIEWAWSDASSASIDQVRYLVALTLIWALSSSHRPTRDNSTKAIIALLEPSPTVYKQLLEDFMAIDDDYIEERLLAIGCGIAQRSPVPNDIFIVAEAVRDFTFGRNYWPENYLSRDYARRVIETALAHGWNAGVENIAASVRPPYSSTWEPKCRSKAEIDALAGPPDYLYSAVSHPTLSDFDDFHKHVVNSAVRSFDLKNEIDANHFGRMIFDRVLELGWTPERFDAIDRHISRFTPAYEKKREGYAQKYIWMAFKQLVGRVADRYSLNSHHSDDHRTQYEAPPDVYGHDIDPTMLLRRTENLVYEDTPKTWFAPIDATFPAHLDGNWPNNDEHSPQIDRLLASRAIDGTTWLVLESQYQWSQPQAPEDAAVRKPHHRIWAQIRSYLIEADDVERWSQWAQGQDWHGRWMPESGSPYGLLLADHPYQSDWPNLEGRDGTLHDRAALPGPFMITTTRYGGVSDSWDQSDSKHLYTFLPSTGFCTLLGLKRIGDFQWGTDHVVAESFAARELGPDTVHVALETLGPALIAQHRCLLWTILAEKETTIMDHTWPEDGQPVSRSYSASYIYDGEGIRLLDANARTLHAGGGVSNIARWNLPTDIRL